MLAAAVVLAGCSGLDAEFDGGYPAVTASVPESTGDTGENRLAFMPEGITDDGLLAFLQGL